MINVKAFMPFIAPYAPLCPDVVACPFVAATAADFCERTGCLKTTCEVSVASGTAEFNIPEVDGKEPETVLHMFVDGEEIAPTLPDLVARVSYGDWTDKSGHPVAYSMVSRKRVHLFPTPDSAVTVKIIFYASVSRVATLLPDEFLDHFRDAIVDGTLARVFRIAGQPFSNTQLANMYEARYEAAVQEHKSDAMQAFMRIGGTVLPNRII